MTKLYKSWKRNRRSERQEEAEARQKARNARSDAEQLRLLEEKGHGHCREAQRLREKLND
jgi:hypothetical protein